MPLGHLAHWLSWPKTFPFINKGARGDLFPRPSCKQNKIKRKEKTVDISEEELKSLLCATYKRASHDLKEADANELYELGQAEGKLIVCEEILIKTHGGRFLYELYEETEKEQQGKPDA